MPLSPGQVLNERYRIVKLLGQGGFGAVYRAWDINLSRPTAVKENLDSSPQSERQFKREAQMLVELTHPNLPRVFDHFLVLGQGQYLVMDFIEGEDLQHTLAHTDRPLEEAHALKWAGQVCDALEYLHSRTPPVIHRDIKPANIRITPKGQAILVDFGVAKWYEVDMRTTAGARAVTPGYAPYEQYGQGNTDARTDIYALGATLYHLLTRQIPPESIQRMGSGVALTPPRQLNPAILPHVEAAILRGMEPLPGQRFHSAAAFKSALNNPAFTFSPAASQAQQVGPVGSLIAPHAPASPHPKSTIRNQQSKISWPLLAGLGGLLALGCLVVIVVLFFLASQFLNPGEKATQQALPNTPAGQTILTLTPATRPTPTFTLPPVTPSATPAIIEDTGARMALIPAGEFQMGMDVETRVAWCKHKCSTCKCEPTEYEQDAPAHSVHVDAFYMDVYEVSNTEFAQCVAAGSCSKAPINSEHYPDAQYSDHPVEWVSWNMAREYCAWRGARLPTEAEWEKAARGGLEGKLYPWGDDEPVCDPGAINGAQFMYCAGLKLTTPRGTYAPNGYGLYDMTGNALEWVSSLFMPYPYNAGDGREAANAPAGSKYVLRGGSWNDIDDRLFVAYRAWHLAGVDMPAFGFRCAKDP